jgi:hypothetical protein
MIDVSQLRPEQHATLLEQVKAMRRYMERLLARLYERKFRRGNEFVQRTLGAQRAMMDLEHYIHSNPPADPSHGRDLPF